jgi:hypothetical protein
MENFKVTPTMIDELKSNTLEIQNEENLANLSGYFSDSGGEKFTTVVEVIATFEKHPQVFFDMLVENRVNDTPREIERNYLVTALRFIGELKADLWKISTCTYNTKYLRPSEQAKVEEFISYKNGKFFFYPHMRADIESQQCFEDSDLARDLLRY